MAGLGLLDEVSFSLVLLRLKGWDLLPGTSGKCVSAQGRKPWAARKIPPKLRRGTSRLVTDSPSQGAVSWLCGPQQGLTSLAWSFTVSVNDPDDFQMLCDSGPLTSPLWASAGCLNGFPPWTRISFQSRIPRRGDAVLTVTSSALWAGGPWVSHHQLEDASCFTTHPPTHALPTLFPVWAVDEKGWDRQD